MISGPKNYEDFRETGLRLHQEPIKFDGLLASWRGKTANPGGVLLGILGGSQPRPQSLSLKNPFFKGKALGTRLGGSVAPGSPNPDPISDRKMSFFHTFQTS